MGTIKFTGNCIPNYCSPTLWKRTHCSNAQVRMYMEPYSKVHALVGKANKAGVVRYVHVVDNIRRSLLACERVGYSSSG